MPGELMTVTPPPRARSHSRLRNAAQAANYRYLASVEGRNFVLTQLIAEIARDYKVPVLMHFQP